MRKPMLSLLASVVLILAAAPAFAATWGGSVYGAFNTYSMKDVNDALEQDNQSFGTNFDAIENGMTGGLELRVIPDNPNWMFSAGWEPVFAKTEESVVDNRELNLDANNFSVSGVYFMPSTGKGKFGIGAGVDMIMISGEATSTSLPDQKLSGNGFGFHVMGTGEWEMSPGFAFTTAAGYRFAKVGDTQFDEQSTTPESETDYSGVVARVGLAFYAPSNK